MSIPVCESLVTKAEFEEFKTQIINLLGKTESEGGTPIDVLAAGSMEGTLIGNGLFFGMSVVANPTLGGVDIFGQGLGGVLRELPDLAREMSRLIKTVKGSIKGLGAILQNNAGLIFDLVNLGIGVANFATNIYLGKRLDKTENVLLQWQNAFNDVYSHLTTAKNNLEQAQNNIDELEGDVALLLGENENLRDSIFDHQIAIGTLEDNLETSERNNAILKENVTALETEFDDFAEYAEVEVTVLKTNIETFHKRLTESRENNENLKIFAQQMGEQVARLEGDRFELTHRLEGFGESQAEIKADIIEIREEIDSETAIRQKTTIKLLDRIQKLEAETGSVGGVPPNVRDSIAEQQNDNIKILSGLLGNPGSVRDTDSDTDIPITTDFTYDDILSGSDDYSSLIDALIASIPSIADITGGLDTVTPDELATFGADLRENIKLDNELALTGILAAGLIPTMNQIRTQTHGSTISSIVTTATGNAICTATEAGGCIKNNVLNPITNNLGAIGQGLGLGLDAASVAYAQSILGRLTKMQEFLGKAWNSTTIQNTLNTANTVLAFHNAIMLSRNLGSTVAETVDLILEAIGVRDFEGNEINVGSWIHSKVTQITTALVGTETLTAVGNTFNAANRILTAGQGILSAANGMKNAVQEGQEIIANRVGTLGNAMLEQGIFEDDSFDFMTTETDFQSPFSKFTDRIESITEFVEEINDLVQTGIEVQENFNELTDGISDFVSGSEELQASFDAFHEDKVEEQAGIEAESASPTIANIDLIKHEPTDT